MGSNKINLESMVPYLDGKFKPAVERLLNADLAPLVVNLLGESSLDGKPITNESIRDDFKDADCIEKFQDVLIGRYLRMLVKNTTEGITVSGLENITRGDGYLFISNHRDIIMDASLINYILYINNFDSAQMVIGNNLVSTPLLEDFFRLNKGIMFKRRIQTKELARVTNLLSGYIYEQVKEGHSVWTSQMEGRAQDGNDKTNPAIIKMLSLPQLKMSETFSGYINSLNMIPVAVSYEFNPCDSLMATCLYNKTRDPDYMTDLSEYANIMLTGVKGFKGRVHISFGKPIQGDFQEPKDVAAAIDDQILSMYKLWESNYAAFELREGFLPEGVFVSNKKYRGFFERLNRIPDDYKLYLIDMYANPVKNSLAISANKQLEKIKV
jgi:hypothetical protein